jgi:hypothetical protein
MQAAFLLRVGTRILSAILGGLAVFCLYYAAQLSDPDVVWELFIKALVSGGAAAAIVYFQAKYLD